MVDNIALQENELRKHKNRASFWLLIAILAFDITAILPKGLWIDFLKAIAETSMVGAFADWFAVAALFKKVPIPLLSRHTSVIPRNKEKIAENLSKFVSDKFFDKNAIIGLIRKHDPAQIIAHWLIDDRNTERLGTYMVKFAGGMLDFIDDAPVQNFFALAAHTAVQKTDLSKLAGVFLEYLTRDERHQVILDQVVHLFENNWRTEGTRAALASKIVQWFE